MPGDGVDLTVVTMIFDAADPEAQRPEVGGRGAGEGTLGQRRIGEPADGRGPAGREAEILQLSVRQLSL